MDEGGSPAPEGAREVEHTADVGIDVRAPDVSTLFHRAAAATVRIVQGEPDTVGETRPESVRPIRIGSGGAEAGGAWERRPMGQSNEDIEELLARWLTEVLYLLEVERFEYVDGELVALGPGWLEARVRGLEDAPPGEREIKGVTYHGLRAVRDADGWTARVIFDL